MNDDIDIVIYQKINVCTVDWGTMANGNYKRSMLSIFDVGLTISDLIIKLRPYGFVPNDITLVGYSLGAHAAGFAGKLLNGSLNEIIGLDPAGPLFTLPSDVGTDYRLDKSDAKFVQVIHTAGGTLGTSLKCGHADFYPNGGVSPQTNCVFTKFTDEPKTNPVGCSHTMAVKFFEISMNPEYPFNGWHCSSYQAYIFGLCLFKSNSRFGIHSERIPGNYFFTTSVSYPYVQRVVV
ncbi:phospholipase A1 member A [Condylostylus longicornis]|uniref:phospholipase A1 member A n=1 Tax=Condylostylus longicornis TaxID=2530218 RepID=UPI00244DC9FD|nr:phospholipase A1 member A [Condylostylus longicornis]